MSFSERHGYRAIRTEVQFESMDDALRIGLWNALTDHWLGYADPHRVFRDFLGEPNDLTVKTVNDVHGYLSHIVLEEAWYSVYDLVEFAADDYRRHVADDSTLEDAVQRILEKEKAGYRLLRGFITPITSEEELGAIEEALFGDVTNPVRVHLRDALAKLSDRTGPDYRNSMKESISAVEALCRQVTGDARATLGAALASIASQGTVELHGSLKQAFDKLYGYTSDAEGIRHAMTDEPALSFEDAKFMLVACAAFVNYLSVKAHKAGIEFT